MTISVWRYSHFALAVSSFIFIALAAITGIMLAFEPVVEKVPTYRAAGFNKITVAEVVPAMKKSFAEVTELKVDANQFVLVKGVDTAGKNIFVYVDPKSGKLLASVPKKNEFFQWVTDFHRSLFLHETGRLFVGITAFLLLLIAISGTVLVIQRQRGVKRFFSRVVKENFAQYYHVVLGRLSLIVILIIALTGTYLSLARFHVFPEKKIVHKINFNEIKSEPAIPAEAFAIFKNIPLSGVQSIEWPFSDDPEDYYTLKLNDREIVVNQFTGELLSEIRYPVTEIMANFSLDLHTGRTSAVWAIILAIAAGNILFFIYSGFAITLKRTAGKIRNMYNAEECRFIILVGSENGSTMRFAKAVHQQLIKNGETSFLTDLNRYNVFPGAEHIVILTSTYGLGDAPANAKKFASLLSKHPQSKHVNFSVVGFGSHAYPDFCRFAFEANNLLAEQSWAAPLLEIHTVSDKSPEQFGQWFETWSQQAGLPDLVLPENFQQKPAGLQRMTVMEKTELTHNGGSFLVKLKPSWLARFNSGDLLAVYPANDHRERFYSIGKIDSLIQLSVKLHEGGVGSGYLYGLVEGQEFEAKIISNAHFQFPQKAKKVVMISNGTGIAPFLGMIDQNGKKTDCHLYCGFRDAASFGLYKESLENNQQEKKLAGLHVAYSREGKKQYVKDLLVRDAEFIAKVLADNGVLMLCGSLAMQHDVIAFLDELCKAKNGKSISFYQSHEQVLMDCY
ncbi:PepSY domain-containing protein [Danxiaibacter flavus]|uniref:PepSY domain-containing protein n=1 Tax=Danxiaibacter flavus TaxID=3049108 RepID=A0ABV3ZM51_9BACT|nr:PepSY domain-containing protein [Chitinophagaceae bacterium DXS]